MPMFRAIDTGYFKKWSRDMAYVLGFFVADGSMITNKRGAHFVEFQVTDKEILLKIKKSLESGHKISVRIRNGNQKSLYRLQIGSKIMFNDLFRLGFTQKKSLTLKFPKVPRKYLADFV